MRDFVCRYLTCVLFLHAWGERAWPWNVRFVWSYVGVKHVGR